MAREAKTPKPKFRKYSIAQIVRELEGKNMNKPEVCYEFSDGSKKVDTDRTNSGVYER